MSGSTYILEYSLNAVKRMKGGAVLTTYDKVKAIADERNMPICAVEKGAGLGNAVIAGWKDGDPSIQSLKKVAEFLDVPIVSLIKD